MKIIYKKEQKHTHNKLKTQYNDGILNSYFQTATYKRKINGSKYEIHINWLKHPGKTLMIKTKNNFR